MPTYVEYLGFGGLQMSWEGFIIDSVLRPGDKHSNHGRGTERMIRRVVDLIRSRSCKDVPHRFSSITDAVREIPQKSWGVATLEARRSKTAVFGNTWSSEGNLEAVSSSVLG